MNGIAQQKADQPFGRTAAIGILWLIGQSLSVRAVSLIGQIILAWLLLPADFGNVGLALTVGSFAGTLVNFGIDDVLLQRQARIRFWLRSAVWVSLGLGLASMALLFVIAPAIGAIFRSPAIIPLIHVVAISIPFGSLATVPTVVLREALNFRFLALCTMAELIVLQIATVLLALGGAGPMSFVLPLPFIAAIKVVVLWCYAAPPLRTQASLTHVHYFFSKGIMVTANRLVTVSMENGDYIILGLMTKPEVVGIYFFAFRLAAMPVRTLAANIQQVMFPVLAKLDNDRERQDNAALEATRLVAFTAMPLCFLQSAVSEPLLLLLFGDKWQSAVPLAQVLSLGLPFDAICWVPFALLSARGQFRRSLVYMTATAGSFFVFVAVGSLWGAVGVAVAVTTLYTVAPIVLCRLIFKSASALTIANLILTPALLSGASVITGYAVSRVPAFEGRLALQVMTITVTTALAYPLLLLVAAPAVFFGFFDRLRIIRAPV